MGTINLAIISEEREYAEALAWAIVRNSKGTEVWVYDDPKHVDNDVSFDVMLADVEKNKLAAYVTKDGSRYAPVEIVLNKYGNVHDLLKKICEMCGRTDLIESGDTSEDVMVEKDVYCFVSERGGSGCSKLSRSFAQEQGMYHGKRVLYFSLDQFPEYRSGIIKGNLEIYPAEMGAPEVSETQGTVRKSLKEYLYRLLKNDNSDPAIGTYLEENENGVLFFRAGEGFNPLLELDKKEYMLFMKAVMEPDGYDMVVIDCGNQVSMQMIRSLELSRRVYLVKDGRPQNTGWRKCVGHLLDDDSRKKIVLKGSL